MATANIIDQRTANLGLPLPNVKNNQADDCPRIVESLKLIDGAYGDARLKAAEAVKISGAAAAEAQNARADATVALSAAESASRDAASAIGLANDAAGAAESAAEAAAAAGEKAAEALSAAGSIRQANATIYLGGSGASDVLCDGRGLIPELPFETMTAALAWVKGNIRPSNLTFLLQGDVDNGTSPLNFSIPWAQVGILSKSESDWSKLICGYIDLYGRSFVAFNRISIECALPTGTFPYVGCISANTGSVFSLTNCELIATPATPKFGSVISIATGSLVSATKCKFVLNDLFCGLLASRSASIDLRHENEFSGTVSHGTFWLEQCSSLTYYTDSNGFPTGDVTGKKYTLIYSSRLDMRNMSADNIPGSEAGVCDTSSTVNAA